MHTETMKTIEIRFWFSILVLLFTSSLSPTPQAQGPSYSCAGTLSNIEEAVCDNAQLSALDEKLSQLYKAVRSTANETDLKTVKTEQRSWMKKRNMLCGAENSSSREMVECIELMYLGRISQLEKVVTTNAKSKASNATNVEDNKSSEPALADDLSKVTPNTTSSYMSAEEYDKISEKLGRAMLIEGYFAFEGGIPNPMPKHRSKIIKAMETASWCAKAFSNGKGNTRTCNLEGDFTNRMRFERYQGGQHLCFAIKIIRPNEHAIIFTEDGLFEEGLKVSKLEYDGNEWIGKMVTGRGTPIRMHYRDKQNTAFKIQNEFSRTNFENCSVF